jgi:hypothetical protein
MFTTKTARQTRLALRKKVLGMYKQFSFCHIMYQYNEKSRTSMMIQIMEPHNQHNCQEETSLLKTPRFNPKWAISIRSDLCNQNTSLRIISFSHVGVLRTLPLGGYTVWPETCYWTNTPYAMNEFPPFKFHSWKIPVWCRGPSCQTTHVEVLPRSE